MKIKYAIVSLLVFMSQEAMAQGNTTGLVVVSCGNQTFKAGNPGPFTIDLTGKICTNSSGAPSGAAGGGLKGTYPNPSLADINSIATSLAIGGATIGTNALAVTGTIGVTAGGSYNYDGVVMAQGQTSLNNFYFGGAGNLTGTGTNNSALGNFALPAVTTGRSNTATGYYALNAVTSGNFNTAIGEGAARFVTTTSNNTAVGFEALHIATSDSNTALGYQTLLVNTTGGSNVAVGYWALNGNITGSWNTAIGTLALYDQAITTNTGQNTALGYNTGRGITTGINNTILGANIIGLSAALSNNVILADGQGNIRFQDNGSGVPTLSSAATRFANGGSGSPSISFVGAITTGFASNGSNGIYLIANGSNVGQVTSGGLIVTDVIGNTSSAYRLFDAAASATVVTVAPNRSSSNTGFGGTTGNISVIVAGAENARFIAASGIARVKGTDPGTAPGAGFAKTYWVAGTNAGTCKLVSYAGTSTTPVAIIDNVGTGC